MEFDFTVMKYGSLRVTADTEEEARKIVDERGRAMNVEWENKFEVYAVDLADDDEKMDEDEVDRFSVKITMQSEHVSIDGHIGTWHVIDAAEFAVGDGKEFMAFLLEHDTYGDEAASLIVDENGLVLADDVWNGIMELSEDYDYRFVRMMEE